MPAPSKVEFYLDNRWVDMAGYVISWESQVGELHTNSFGHVMEPSVAALTLRNKNGVLNTTNPGMILDTATGDMVQATNFLNTPVRITGTGNRIFTGWGLGLQEYVDRDVNRISTMNCLGSLARIDQFFQELYRPIDGVPYTGEVLNTLLDNINWPSDRIPVHDTPARAIQHGNTQILSAKFNEAGISGSGRERVSFLDAAGVLANAEASRIYDNQDGSIVFEEREHRGREDNKRVWLIDYSTGAKIHHIQSGDIVSNVINILSSDTSSFVSRGEQRIPLRGVPSDITVLPRETYSRTFQVLPDNDEERFVQSWVLPLVRGDAEDYVYSDPTVVPEVTITSNSITISFTNPTSVTHTGRFLGVSGELFAEEVFQTISKRVANSIAVYGERPDTLAAEVIANALEIRHRLEYLVEVHSGMEGDTPSLDPVKQYDIIFNVAHSLNNDFTGARVSDIVQITEPKLGLTNERFWIEAIQYTQEEDGRTLDMTLQLKDIRSTTQWPIADTVIGENTRLTYGLHST